MVEDQNRVLHVMSWILTHRELLDHVLESHFAEVEQGLISILNDLQFVIVTLDAPCWAYFT